MPILFELFAGHSGPRTEGAQGNLDGLRCARGFAASRVQFGLEERMQGDLFGGRNRQSSLRAEPRELAMESSRVRAESISYVGERFIAALVRSLVEILECGPAGSPTGVRVAPPCCVASSIASSQSAAIANGRSSDLGHLEHSRVRTTEERSTVRKTGRRWRSSPGLPEAEPRRRHPPLQWPSDVAPRPPKPPSATR